MIFPADAQEIVRRAGIDLFILFGSRVRGEARPDSDWDFAYRVDGARAASFDPDTFLAELVRVLGSDRIDLVDLSRGSALLRFRIAADGQPVHQADPHAFREFQLEAISFWCDVAPVLDRSYEEVLARLGPP